LGILGYRDEFLAGSLAGRRVDVVCVFDNSGKLADREIVASMNSRHGDPAREAHQR
jgi:hypothetical protein